MRLFLICVNVSEEYYFHSHSFTSEDTYLKIIIKHLLCAFNEVAHGIWPQDIVSSKSTRITQKAHCHIKSEIHYISIGVS